MVNIRVLSFAHNNKFPISLQYNQFKKHVKEPFTFAVMNDASKQQDEAEILAASQALGVTMVRLPQSIHASSNNPSDGYGHALNWTLRSFLPCDPEADIAVLVHTDVFPVFDVSILDLVGEGHIASTAEARVCPEGAIVHLYPALTIVHLRKTELSFLDFSCRHTIGEGQTLATMGLDTGGQTFEYLKRYGSHVRFLPSHQLRDAAPHFPSPNPSLDEYFRRIKEVCSSQSLNAGWYADGFYHFIAGSQWIASSSTAAQIEAHRQKMALCTSYFSK
jgi:hypothetical protein